MNCFKRIQVKQILLKPQKGNGPVQGCLLCLAISARYPLEEWRLSIGS